MNSTIMKQLIIKYQVSNCELLLVDYTQLMIRKYIRSLNSQKYNNKMHVKQQHCFDMTLADMDFGIYEPLHSEIMKIFQKAVTASQNDHKSNLVGLTQNLYKSAKQSIIDWYLHEFKCEIEKCFITFCSSIVALCSYCIMSLTNVEHGVMVTTPVYSSYIAIIQALNRKVIACQLTYKPSSQSGAKVGNFYIDFCKFEDCLKKSKLLILSHPHNPSGRVWTKNEVQKIVQLCKLYNVAIVSDQILADLYLQSNDPNNQFYSFGRQFPQYNRIAVANSVSKSFNYSSLQGGYAITNCKQIANALSQTMEGTFGEKVDLLGISAICGCLTQLGRQWLRIIRGIIQSNYLKLVNFKQNRATKLQIALLEAAYLVYVDFSAYFQSQQQLTGQLNKSSIWLLPIGSNYYPIKTKCLQMRICIACSEQHFLNFLCLLFNIIQKSHYRKRNSSNL